MSVGPSVADILDDHVTLEVECIDRMYLNVYVPGCSTSAASWASSAPSRPRLRLSTDGADHQSVRRSIHDFVQREDIPLVSFRAGQRKDDIARRHLAGFDQDEGVVFVGRAQEKTAVFRTKAA